MNICNGIWPAYKLGDPDVCILNPKKKECAEVCDETLVSFVPMAQVDDISGCMDASLSRKLGGIRKGYTYFSEGDVVFAKITPCMENGKSAVARNLINGIGFGSTEFHVLRSGPLIIPEWLLLFVRNSYFRNAARKNMHGAAGQQRVPVEFLQESEIPVPPLDEQRRIVARIEELNRRAEEVRRFSLAREKELDVLLQSAYGRMIAGVEWEPLSKVASLVRRGISVKLGVEYEEMGIRSFGKGTFKKPILTGKEIGNKRIYRIHEGDLVFNNVFAWEGAIAVAQEADQDRVGSHRFITYIPHEWISTSEFLCHHFLSERGIEDIRAASPGSAGRNRTLGLKKLEQVNVPVPDYHEQTRFAEMAKRRTAIRRECATIEKELKIFQSALLTKAFRGEL